MALEARLDLEPADAVRFFAAKGEALSWDYTDTWREANVHAFTVAKATTQEVLRTIRGEVAKSIGEGQTLEAFKKTLRPRLQDLGWWGRQEVLDGETGEISQVQLGSDRRLRTIYQTNVQTAYMAGRFKRLRDNVGDRPYWRYVAVMDGRTRPAHAALHGRVWRWDDPAWEVIFPPCGWGCRCRVTALTEAEFSLLGVELEKGDGAIVELEVPIGRDKKTTVTVQGVRYRDEAGREKVFRPDPGWDYNPGAEWARFDANGFKGEASPVAPITPQTSTIVKQVEGQKTWKDYGRPDLRDIDPAWRQPDPGMLPKAPSRSLAQQMLIDVLLPGGQAMRQIDTPVETVVIRRELLPHLVGKEPDGRERYANYILPTLQRPFETWLTAYNDGTYRKRYFGLFQARNDLLVVVRENPDGSLFWEVYNMMQRNRRQLNQLRVGEPLFGEVGR